VSPLQDQSPLSRILVGRHPCASRESAERIPGAPTIPEGARFAAAYALCASRESAERIPGALKIPEGARFAAAFAPSRRDREGRRTNGNSTGSRASRPLRIP